ncbi:MAG TPA: signal peptidase II [Bacteroidetes bacterium]|nr:signal peptidase II [Bacteroidota bacterium]
MNTRKKYILFFAIIIIGVALDQFTKQLAVKYLQGPGIYDGDAFFSWAFAENDGAFLSLGSSLPDGLRLILLTIVPGILLVGVMIYMLRSKTAGVLENIVFALISAGGIGNIIDRIMAGKVVDFMHMNYFGIAETGIFNVADLYIVFGIILYVIAYFINLRKQKAALAAAEDSAT